MSDHDHDHNHGDKPLLSRRAAARHALRAALGMGVAVIGLAAASTTPAKAGYGACSISGCPCQAYMGGADLCQNCGHQYQAHW